MVVDMFNTFDQQKDVTLAEIPVNAQLSVKVMRYAGGKPKVQIVRVNSGRYIKLGRLAASELQELLPALLTALEHIQSQK